MGDVVILPVVRTESEGLAAQEALRLKRWDPNERARREARERAARAEAVASDVQPPCDSGD